MNDTPNYQSSNMTFTEIKAKAKSESIEGSVSQETANKLICRLKRKEDEYSENMKSQCFKTFMDRTYTL